MMQSVARRYVQYFNFRYKQMALVHPDWLDALDGRHPREKQLFAYLKKLYQRVLLFLSLFAMQQGFGSIGIWAMQ